MNISLVLNIVAVLAASAAVHLNARCPLIALSLAFAAGLILGLTERWAVGITPADS
jgi:hypothetical protein